MRVGTALDPVDALRHAREAGLELGDTVAQGDEPIVRRRLVGGAEDRDREPSIRDGQGLLLSGGLSRCLGSALPVGVGLLRLIAAELRLEVEEVDEDLFLVFTHPSSLSVSAVAISLSPVRVMLCHAVLADQPVFRLRSPTVRTLVRLSVTPVKALRLSHPREADLTTGGIPTDRRFYLIDDAGALFDASDLGSLLRIVPDYDPSTERLRCTFPDGSAVEGTVDGLGATVTTDFFGRPVEGRLVTDGFSEAFSSALGRSVRLVRVKRDGDGQDVHPLTIVSSASVRAIGTHGGRPDLDPRRFRIQLEIDGCDPYEEDSWDGGLVRVGEATIRVRGQIPRCIVTTLGPDTGDKDFTTLNLIARTRPRIEGRRGLPFGMYAEVVDPGHVRVGDPVEPVSARPTEATSVAGR